MFIPSVISLLVIKELLPILKGEPIIWSKMWSLWGIGIAGAVLTFLLARREYKATYLASYMESENMRIRIADHLSRLPISYFNRKDLTDLTSTIMEDMRSLESMLSSTIPQLLANIVSSIIVSILLAFLDWRMALVMFISIPIGILLVYLSKRRQEDSFVRLNKSNLQVEKQIQEYLEGIKIIKSHSLEETSYKAVEAVLDKNRSIAMKVELVVGILISSANIIMQLGIALVIIFGIYFLLNSQIDIFVLLSFLVVATKFYGPFMTILSQLSNLLNLNVVTQRMRNLLDAKIQEGQESEIRNYDIEIKDLSFAYGDELVLDNINLKLEQGQVSAIVGPSGSGKSTFVSLIPRFWDVDKGIIRIDDKDIREILPDSLMKYMAFVFQDVSLFNDTIYNNIKIGKISASEDEIIQAAKVANCHDFIMTKPQGYQTLIGEDGMSLSGGERQRISSQSHLKGCSNSYFR